MLPVNTSQRPEMFYRFEKEIGTGSFSKVYLAVHKFSHVKSAVKVVVKSERKQKDLERLYSEIQIMSKLNHPNIVKLEQVYDIEGRTYLFMEYCDHGDLFDLIVKVSFFTEDEALPILRQIVEPVKYLHHLGIAHRDLKPENILISLSNLPPGYDFILKLADFGFAKQAGGRNNVMTSDVGTPDYAAPEILGQKYTLAVDMWAIGCILYCMLFSVPPFYSEDASETLDKITSPNTEVTFPEDFAYSSNAKDLILRLLNRNPAERLTAAQVFSHPWCQGLTTSGQKRVKPPTEQHSRGDLRRSLNQSIEIPFGKP